MTDLPPLETEPRSAEAPGPSDAELITAVRSGDKAAFGPLYLRHVGAARALARQMTRDPNEAEDLVSEAFAKVLTVVQGGGGPDVAFRAYLLTALRRIAYDRTRAGSRVTVSDDLTPYDPGVPFVDPALEGLEKSIVSRAYTSLPERWQTVLWHTEVEGLTPAQVAPILGLTANGVAALAYRAREGLRQAYLQQHLAAPLDDGCRPYSDRLGAYARGGLSKRETAQVEEHLDTCARCRELVLELTDVGSGMRAVVAPLILGLAVAGYLSSGALLGTGSVVAGAGALAGAGATGTGTGAGAGVGAGAGAGAGAGVGAGTGAAAASTGAAAAGGVGAGTAAAVAAGVVGAGALTAAVSAGAQPAAAAGAGAGAGAAGTGAAAAGTTGGAIAGGAGGSGAATVTVSGAGGGGGGLLGLGTGGWVTGAAAAAVGLVGAGIVAAVVIGGGGGSEVTGSPPGASGPVLPGATSSSGTSTSGPGTTSSSETPLTPPVTATPTSGSTATATAPPSTSATHSPTPTPSPSGTPSSTPTGTPSASPSGSPTGSGSPSPSPSPTETPKAALVVTYTPLGDLVQGRPGVVGFAVANTGDAASGPITATVALPSGVRFVGLQSSGSAFDGSKAQPPKVMDVEATDGWTCIGTDAGATCTRTPLTEGTDTQVYLDVDAADGSGGSTPVSVTVSADGLEPVTVSGTRGVQQSGLAARFAATGTLRVTEVGNGLLSCPGNNPGCADARLGQGNKLDDDDWSMTPFNQAGDKTTASSAADLQLPPGVTVRWAGLYWSGGLIPNSKLETLKLRGPGAAGYTLVAADRTDTGTESSWSVFQSYADVTDLVTKGGPGTWWAADPQVLHGNNKYAGWSLVVVYDDPTAPVDQVTVFDGFAQVVKGGQPQSFTVVPRASGQARIGTVAWEGDLGIPGDAISLDGTDLVPQGGTQDSTNVMDSSAAGALGPSNTFGTDVDSFGTTVATTGNPVVTARTTGDTYFLGVLTVSDS